MVPAAELEQLINEAMQHHAAGRLAEAQALYRRVLDAEPRHVDALHFLGFAELQLGRPPRAVELISQALSLHPGNAPAHNNLGAAQLAQGQVAPAIASFRRALELAPDFLEARVNLGRARASAGELPGDIDDFDTAAVLAPADPAILRSLGNELARHSAFGAASACYRRALALKADLPEVHCELGDAQLGLGRLKEAVACYREALRLNPALFFACYNLAIALRGLGRHEEAKSAIERALILKPDSADAHYLRGHLMREEDRRGAALESFRKALALKPEFAEARWSCAISELPAVYGVDDDPASCRSAFARALGELERWFDASRVDAGFRAVGTQQPFAIAYQEEDNRALLQQYGALCARLMGQWQRGRKSAQAAPARSGRPRLRVGIVSQYFRNHSVWNAIVKGWFQRVDAERFELHAFCLTGERDEETAFAETRAAQFDQGPRSFEQWLSTIEARGCDALIYPELGMDPTSLKLASLRLAPVQAASWGHPETTGLPTIDYFLSAAGLEPHGAQQHYSEKLVPLPNLGCYLEPAVVEVLPAPLAQWGIDSSEPLLVCPGTPFKYAPQHDAVIVAIARKLGRCRFVFFDHVSSAMMEKLRRRLRAAFEREGLEFERFVSFIPWLTGPAFRGLLQSADLYLDTIGFSGFNTALQAVECGLPVVTRQGRFLRGRLASGILERAGVPELVAASEQDYVALAERLVRDADFDESVVARLEAGRSRLYGDAEAVRGLEAFLTGAVPAR
jgi:predicted O-linked N-acetylglucosamine transferase (SPINDLY family)